MPRRKEKFTQDRPYHVMSRAVEGREVFSKEEDCARFLFLLYAANIGSPAPNLHRVNIQEAAKQLLEGSSQEHLVKPEHSPLVEIFSFVLARDHYHLGLVPTSANGITQYMQKVNLGFAKYYNLKYERRGSLFEGRFRIISIRTPVELDAVVRYINVKNVLDVYDVNWEYKGIDDEDSAIRFLKEYPYSSFSDLFLQRSSFLLSPASRFELKKLLKDDFKAGKDSYQKIFEYYITKKDKLFHHVFLDATI